MTCNYCKKSTGPVYHVIDSLGVEVCMKCAEELSNELKAFIVNFQRFNFYGKDSSLYGAKK